MPRSPHRWFSLPNLFWFLPVPLLVLLCSAWGIVRAIKREAHYSPFLLTLGLIFLGFSGLGISLWPNIIPPAHHPLGGRGTAAEPGLYAGRRAVLIIPVILVYTSWSYYVFRGKIKADEGYH